MWDAITGKVSAAMETVSGIISSVMNTVKGVISRVWDSISSKVSSAVSTVKNTVTSVFQAVKDTAETVWNGIKDTLSPIVDTITNKVSTGFTALQTSVSTIFDSIKTKATAVWESIRNAITGPVEAAKETVRNTLNSIEDFFSRLRLQLPHIALPHFSVSGTLSISPPSVPTLSINWYKQGGIMTGPTIFGMNGSSLMAGGEAGAEAILPLSGFYRQLEAMLTEKLNTESMEKYLAIIADNSSKGIYLEDGTLVGHLLPTIDSRLGQVQKLSRRLAL